MRFGAFSFRRIQPDTEIRPDPAGSRWWKERLDVTKLLGKIYGNKNESDMENANIGLSGTKVTYNMAQGDREQWMYPNWHHDHRRPDAPNDEESDEGGEVYGPVWRGRLILGKAASQ